MAGLQGDLAADEVNESAEGEWLEPEEQPETLAELLAEMRCRFSA